LDRRPDSDTFRVNRADVSVLPTVVADPRPGKCLAVAATPVRGWAVMKGLAAGAHRGRPAAVGKRWNSSMKLPDL